MTTAQPSSRSQWLGLPEPKGRQREVLYLPADGHLVVLGTAGSGKTTLALLRSHYLATHPNNPGRTLLVTFNLMLTTYLKTIAPGLHSSVDVRNYHHFARGYLTHRNQLPRSNAIVKSDEERVALVEVALESLRRAQPRSRFLQHAALALAEEIVWIERMGIGTRGEYQEAERVKRGGLRVAGADRGLMWQVYEEYLEARSNRGYRYDWDDLAQGVLDEFSDDTDARFYRHVVIDEGQDFSPTMLRSLTAAVPETGTVTFFGDMAQQIYGSRVSWRDAGLHIPDGVYKFQENYRNTQQIAEFALALANGPHFRGVPDMVAPRSPRAEGIPPTIVECSNRDAERALAVRQAVARAKTQSVAILLRDRDHEDVYRGALESAGIRPRRLHKTTPMWHAGPGVWLGTYYAGKGLEFDSVILPHLDAETVPDKARLIAVGDLDVALSEEARLLYVACTRARSQLVLSYSGAPTALLDDIDPALYVRQSA